MTSTFGAELLRAFFLTVLAKATGNAGQPEEGLRLSAEALQVVERTGECFYEVELYRLKGELTLQQLKMNDVELKIKESKSDRHKGKIPSLQPLTSSAQAEVEQEAEACFLKAIAVVQRQQAKFWELRVTMSLVRLRQRQIQDYATYTTQHESHHRSDGLTNCCPRFTAGLPKVLLRRTSKRPKRCWKSLLLVEYLTKLLAGVRRENSLREITEEERIK